MDGAGGKFEVGVSPETKSTHLVIFLGLLAATIWFLLSCLVMVETVKMYVE